MLEDGWNILRGLCNIMTLRDLPIWDGPALYLGSWRMGLSLGKDLLPPPGTSGSPLDLKQGHSATLNLEPAQIQDALIQLTC